MIHIITSHRKVDSQRSLQRGEMKFAFRELCCKKQIIPRISSFLCFNFSYLF